MDLYVKLQGLKYNSRKVWGCFCKIQVTGKFPDLLIFLLKNRWNRSTGVVDWVHNPRSRVHDIGISSGPFNLRSRSRIITREGVWLDLILSIHLGTNGCGGFSFLWLRGNRGDGETSMASDLGGSTPRYRVPLTVLWAPTRSRRR
jgi:hypothetical protein